MKISNLETETRVSDRPDQFALDVLHGLSADPKSLSSKYFYDDYGSELFQKITGEKEYYLTKCEFEILDRLAGELPSLLDENQILDVIEFGAGDGHKTKLLLDGLLKSGMKIDYYPVDISEKAMLLLMKNIYDTDYLKINGVVGDYFAGLRHVQSISSKPKLVLFLGSSIGNMEMAEATAFLKVLKRNLKSCDSVLIGFDQKKSAEILNRAYNDSAGYTTQFNLNILERMNRELGANFDLQHFQHYGFYNPRSGAMESHLISQRDQMVYVQDLKRSFHFERFEPLHLEYSFKYLPSDIEALAETAGFTSIRHFTDEKAYFIDSLWGFGTLI
jgi:L-histidine N-alpha-methyltransferase